MDAKTDVSRAAVELETLLHSRITTAGKLTSIQTRRRLDEHILTYPAPRQPYETDLSRELRSHFGGIAAVQEACEKAKAIAAHLGSWCADQYLRVALSERRLRNYEASIEQTYHTQSTGQTVAEMDSMVADLRQAFAFLGAQRPALSDIVEPTEPFDISGKVQALAHWLSLQFERPSANRCIVFVEQKSTARMLHLVLEKIGNQHLRSGFLIGARNTKVDEENFSLKQQVLILMKFRKGELNCLFATSVAEEGLDVPDCNLVIRFDMYQTMIQYVQSRGRARQNNSKFVHMIEQGNAVHTQRLQEVRFHEMAMRSFCETLPQDRQVMSEEDSIQQLLAGEKKRRVWIDPTTGAKLTYDNALVYLANLVSAVPTELDEPQHPTYAVTNSASRFIAEVILPANAPVKSAIGKICDRKALAKRSAAFEACLELRKRDYLDGHLMPTYARRLPAMRNAHLAVNMSRSNAYPMMTKPTIWERTKDIIPVELWITMIEFPDGLEREHRPLAFLTRTPMPQFPSFPLYLSDGRRTTVVSSFVERAMAVTQTEVTKLAAFTFRIFKDVFSKTYAENAESLPYFLAPALPPSAGKALAGGSLDWTPIDEAFSHEAYKWTPSMEHDFLLDRFLVDIWDGSRKFYSKSIHPSLRPQDAVPADAAKAKWNANILDYSVSLFKNSRAKVTWTPEQPVIEAEKITFRRNMLATPDRKEVDVKTAAYLCPEPLRISVIPPAVVCSCFAWPAVLWRLESYLIALEACSLVGMECEPKLALAAITKDSDNSGEHDEEQINFRKGMGENYERLEFLGDSFLKTATTMSTFIQNPNDNEFDFHVKRMLLLCNKKLFEVGKELELHKYIRTLAFSRRLWYPEGLELLGGKGSNKVKEELQRHSLGEKTIADVSEALIGAALLSHDKPGNWHPDQWESAIRTVTKLVNDDGHRMLKWDDYRRAYQKPAYQTQEATASQRDMAEQIEKVDRYHFRSATLLRSAFLHPSQPTMWEKLPTYQRLEFLGDALLDQAIITHLFYRFPDKDPQWLTEAKMVIVGNRFLGALACSLDFHKHIRKYSSVLQSQILEYSTELSEARRVAGDAKDYWTTVSDPPKCLADVVEAYVGAVFVDSDFDYGQVQRFFDAHVAPYFADMAPYAGYVRGHPVTQLHQLLQATLGCRDFRVMTGEMPALGAVGREGVVVAVLVHREVVAHSRGSSSRYASVRAAKAAIEMLEGLAPYEFRKRFGCDCGGKDGDDRVVDQEAAGDVPPTD